MMYSEPAAWKRLMEKLVTVQADYLLQQARAGASALQLFDSWAGAVSKVDYQRYVQPYNRALFKMLERAGVPTINFSTRTGAYLEEVAACGGDVVGVDWQLPLDEAWARIGHERPIQGNLEPVALLAPWRELRARVDDVLDRAEGRPGHIFNLGHGIFPETPVENVRRLVDYVHERTAALETVA
jgi:uroporphyrinogen decarboxylase